MSGRFSCKWHESTDVATNGACLHPTSLTGSDTSAVTFIARWSFPRDWCLTLITSTPREESPSTVANTTRGDIEERVHTFCILYIFLFKKVLFLVVSSTLLFQIVVCVQRYSKHVCSQSMRTAKDCLRD